jgi:hypothetical protein
VRSWSTPPRWSWGPSRRTCTTASRTSRRRALRTLVESGKTAIYGPDFTIEPEVVAALSGGDRPSTADQVRQRALAGLAEEIRFMLDEGVVAAPEDLDLCMIMGAGWPFHLGGITPCLDRTGIAAKVTGSRFRWGWVKPAPRVLVVHCGDILRGARFSTQPDRGSYTAGGAGGG